MLLLTLMPISAKFYWFSCTTSTTNTIKDQKKKNSFTTRPTFEGSWVIFKADSLSPRHTGSKIMDSTVNKDKLFENVKHK